MSQYYTLLTSLPHLPVLEKSRQLPISRLALESRLSMLCETDCAQLDAIEALYFPNPSVLSGLADREVVQAWKSALLLLESDVLKERIAYQLEIRSLLAALRYREAGGKNPDQFIGFGRWHSFIKNHWFEPFFGMDEFQPQIQKIARYLKENRPGHADKLLDQMLWQDLFYCEKQQGFSFSAVACYVLRWGIVSRYLSADADAALIKFDDVTRHLLMKTTFIDDLNQESANR
ncbi:hypothetical protein [Neptunomonas japonica]|uniref:V-type H+-transporting ATPase subunit n=1 Tax=Neptunomonas japonica JAMM 1380 TaxID=1441457 RepID=A0A7R6SV71_9GAMM|nr:hypothetical protein [Neptunomonas japonica]BBB28425.1 V-type H+-transporting ATPase subunit [Neptunomonas japonica JAMM 1380]